jgi:GNAT superfamily N-acetyltransferase
MIRFATIDDLPEIRTLWKHLGADEPRAYPEGFFAKPAIDTFTRQIALALTVPEPTAFVLLAFPAPDEHPVGLMVLELQERSIGEPARYIFVHWLFTERTHRGQGIGTALIEMAAEFALSKGLAQAEITYQPGTTSWDYLQMAPFEVRAHAPLTQVLLRSEQRRQQWQPAREANGLDADEVSLTSNIEREDT